MPCPSSTHRSSVPNTPCMIESEINAGCKTRSPVLGILLPQKKASKHLTPSLLHHASAEGVTLRVLEEGVPLISQGRFDVLLHKIRSPGGTIGGVSLTRSGL